MKKYLFITVIVLCLVGCTKKQEGVSTIKGHLIEGSTGRSLANVKVTLFDDAKVYATVFSDEAGLFSMSTFSLLENFYYKLSFYWDNEHPAKVITVINVPEVYDLGNFVVYDQTNPYDYRIYNGYMIHKTLDGLYTFDEANEACRFLRDGYDDWVLPETDFLDILADDEDLAREIAEEGWYWGSWITNGYNGNYYYGVNIWANDSGTTTNPNEKLKVLPVRKHNKSSLYKDKR